MKIYSPLYVIASVFILGSGFRFMEGDLHAIASEKLSKLAREESQSLSLDKTQDGETATPQKVEVQLEKAIFLHNRGQELDFSKTTLKALNDELSLKLERLMEIEAALSNRLSTAVTASEKDIGQLAAVYSQMKPAAAAEIFSQMQPSFAAGLLAQMSPDIAAKIVAAMPATTAHAISVSIAGRNANFSAFEAKE